MKIKCAHAVKEKQRKMEVRMAIAMKNQEWYKHFGGHALNDEIIEGGERKHQITIVH